MTALEILIAARDWLAVGPERWCQHQFGRDRNGKNLYAHQVHAHNATSCCAGGAIRRCGRRSIVARDCALDALTLAVHGDIAPWNDSLPPGRAGWERVIEAFGKAIEAEKAALTTQAERHDGQ